MSNAEKIIKAIIEEFFNNFDPYDHATDEETRDFLGGMIDEDITDEDVEQVRYYQPQKEKRLKKREPWLLERTTERLIEMYAEEFGRIDKNDRKINQNAIKAELKERFRITLALLDDEQSRSNPKGTYKRLIEG